MKKYIYISILVLLSVVFVSANNNNFISLLKKYLEVYNKQLPQEKAYVQTDKTYYKPGETLWYKAFLMNSTDNKASHVSDIMYVELTDPWGNVVKKNAHNFSGGTCNGEVEISADAAGGLYKLTAYTKWMRNWGDEALFTKEITVQKVITPRLLLKLDFEKRAYGAGDRVVANLKVTDLDNNKTNGSVVKSTVRIGGQTVQTLENKTEDGEVSVIFNLPDDLNTADGILQIIVNDKGIEESVTRSVPIVINKIAMEFFPEGGTLSNNVISKIAFKAVNEFGKGADISGNIIDDKGAVITNFESFHLGMGTFEFTPQQGKTYYAVITTPKGNNEKLELPKADADNYVLNLQLKDSTKTVWNIYEPGNSKYITFIAQTQGLIHYSKKINLKKGQNTIEVPTVDFPIGAAVFTLFDGQNREVCRRMVYLNEHKALNIEIESKDEYMQGDYAKIKIKTTDENGKPVSASLGMAIVDEQLLTMADDKQDNIMTYTLFSSELDGKIQEPYFYFDKDEKKAKEAIDYLMLTHEWKRFSWNELLQDGPSTEHIKEYPEKLNSVYGFILDKKGKPVQAEVFLIETGGKRRIGQLKTTPEGHFVFHNVDNTSNIFVSTKLPNQVYILSSKPSIAGDIPIASLTELKEIKTKIGEVDMDKDVVVQIPKKAEPQSDALEESVEREFSDMQENRLDEVVIVGYGTVRKQSVTGSVKVVKSEDILANSNITGALSGSITGVAINPRNPSLNVEQQINIRGVSSVAGSDPLIVINGIPTSDPSLSFINPSDIESMQVLKNTSATAIYGSRAANGAIFIETKKSRFRERTKYRKSKYGGVFVNRKQIYNPKQFNYYYYNRDGEQSTVFWDGSIVTDSKGEVNVNFENNKQSSTFRITVEGFVPDRGLIGSQTKRIVTNKPLSVDAKAPLFVGVGDMLKMPVMVKNTTDKRLRVKLDVRYPNHFTRIDKINEVEVAPDEYKTVYIAFSTGAYTGDSDISIYVNASGYTDHIYRRITVRPINFPYTFSFSGQDAGKTVEMNLDEYVPGTLKAEAVCYSNMMDELFDGVESIFREPYGCFEQVSSSTFPNIFALQLMKATGQNNPEVYKKAIKYLEAGYKKLAAYEVRGTGGFEWYGGTPAHEVLSAYGLVEFYEMGKVYDCIDTKMMNRTFDFIMSRRDGNGGFKQNRGKYGFSGAPKNVNNAYIVYALTETGYMESIEQEYQATLREAIKSNDIYRKALLANAAYNMDDKASYRTLIAEFKALAEKTEFPKMKVEATIVRSYGETAQREAVAFWMIALLKDKENMDNALINKCIEFINMGRRYGSFGNTQATSICLQALTKYAESVTRPNVKGSLCLTVNGIETCKPLSEKARLIMPFADMLKVGKNKIGVKFMGADEYLPYSVNISWQTTIPATSKLCPLKLTTDLGQNEMKINETVRLSVKLENTQKEAKPMSVAIIGIPGGLSLQPWQLKELQEQEVYDFYEIINDNLVIYYRELGPNEVKTINLDLKAEVPGIYTGIASSAYVYYMNEHKYWINGLNVNINE